MNCQTLTGITKDCYGNVGGIRNVKLFRVTDVDEIETFAYTEGIGVVNITLLTDVEFTDYYLKRGVGSYTVNLSVDNMGVQEYLHTLVLKFNRREAYKHGELTRLAQGNKRLMACVKDANNFWWLLGYDAGLRISDNSGSSGTAKPDGSGYNVTLIGIQSALELPIVGEAFINFLDGNTSSS